MPDGSELSQSFDEAEEFVKFIRNFRDESGNLKYRARLEQAVASGSRSLVVDFDDLLQFNGELGRRIVKNPIEILPELEKHSRPELASIDPAYASKLKRFNVRIRGLPEKTPLRGIKTEHLNTLVAVEGIVVRSTQVKSLLVVGRFVCKRCGERQDVPQSGDVMRYPAVCGEPSCAQRGSGAFELLESESEFVDVQEIRLQERPEDLPAGQLPRTADIHVFDDMVDVARPGDRVTLVGIVVGEAEYHPFRGRYRTFNLKLQCNYMEVAGLEEEDVTISEEEEREFIKMSKDAWLFKKLVASVAPSIFGLEDEKEAIILQMLGGNAKELPDGVRIRGDINVFLIGDPGTAKSQLLKYVQKIAPRGLYTSGRGTTAAGLTATAVRERMGGFVLEAGALVLADRGIAAIDEFEKMRPEDRVAIHEAMEQQSYHPSVEISLADGRKVKIGDYVEGLFSRFASMKVRGVNCEILPLPFLQEIYSIDPLSGSAKRFRIDRVSRHKAPDSFVSITYSNGRSILVTPEHPVYVFREGRVATVPASCVREGEFVPAPARIQEGVSVSPRPLSPPRAGRKGKGASFPAELTPRVAAALGYLVAIGRFLKGRGEIVFESEDPSILGEVESLMAEVFGMARAPGAGSGCSRLLRYASSPLLGWLELNFPEIARKARRRRVPAEIFQSNEDVAGEFLRSAFLGGGSFGSDAARYVAASKGLAEDYQDLLLKFGIASLVARGVKGAPFKVSVAGSDLVRFEDEIIRSSGSAGAGPPRLFADRCRASGALSRLLAPGRCGAEARPGPIQAEHQRLAEAGKNSALAREALAPKLRLLRVVRARPIPNAGRHGTDWVYDVTVEPTHNFVSHGVLLHNTCSVAKGGIVATLNARTAILAAANPSLGRYDPSKLFIENVNLPPTILSRFDLIFVLKDVPDEEKDRRLADHILGYHRRGLGAGQDVIDQVKLRKYLSYCKKVKPKLTQEAADRLNDFFLEMRRLSLGGSAPMAITPRQLESLIRLSEARAKVFLRSEVLVEDAEAAIALMKKSLVQAGMDVETGQIDVDTLMTGKSKSTRDKMGKLLDLVAKLEASSGSANLDELEGLAEKEGIDRHDFGRLVSAMLREGLLYSPDEQSVKRARR